MYRLRDLHKSFGDKHVLKGVDLDIYEGECLVILGGSGTGKSVLLKTLIGLHAPDKGEMSFDDQNLLGLKERDFYPIRKQVSYLFQGGALFDSMNVYQNLAYPLKEHTDMPDRQILEKARTCLEMVELKDVEHLYPSDLSGGMMKRVALARAIINSPRAVLYDEPTTGLDPVTTHTINQMIRKLQKELEITSVVVTHDMNTARYTADRLIFLEAGQVTFSGTLDEAEKTDNALLRAYLHGGASVE